MIAFSSLWHGNRGLFFGVGAGLDGRFEILAKECTTAIQSEAFAGVDDRAVFGAGTKTVHFVYVSNQPLELQAFGFGRVFDRERGHPCLLDTGETIG